MNKLELEGNPLKVFISYLIPSTLSMITVSVYTFVDTFVVGRAMNSEAVAAIGLGTPALTVMYALGFLFGAGGAVQYAVALSEKDTSKCRKLYSTAFFATLFVGIILIILGRIFLSPICDFLGASSANKAMTMEYVSWIVSLCPFIMLDMFQSCFIKNDGHPKVSMIAIFCGTALNIVLDFWFVMGLNWGLGGAAFATCLGSITSFTVNFLYGIIAKTNLIPRIRLFTAKKLPRIMKIGLGTFILEVSVSVVTVVFLRFAGKYYGDAAIAAYTVVLTFNLIAYSLINGACQSAQPLISMNFGAGKSERIGAFVRYALTAALTLGLVLMIIAVVFAKPLCNLFIDSSEADVLPLAAYGLKLNAISFMFMAISILYGVYFQAITKAAKSIFILFGRSILMPIVALFVVNFIIGRESLWFAVMVAKIIVAIIAILMRIIDAKRATKQSQLLR